MCEEAQRGKRIEDHCNTIWGNSCYDLDIETDDHETYQCSVKEDRGTSFGPVLAMSGLCPSESKAWDELERILGLWARQVRSGKPMTEDQKLDIFGGYKGQQRQILKLFRDELNRQR